MSLGNRSRRVSVASVITMIVAASSAYFGYNGGGVPMKRKEVVNTPCISAFQFFLHDPIETDAAKRALSLIQDAYHQGYYNSSISHHYFVRTAPVTVQDTLSEFVWSDSALKQVRTKFEMANDPVSPNNDEGIKVIHDVFDEIYLMRPEFDLLDEKKIHYDGNLKIPGICTIRALTYLSGKDATFFALTSQQNYTTKSHSSVVLDFDREMHYVSLNEKSPAPFGSFRNVEPRVMVKSALHVVLPGTNPFVANLRIVLHRIMVFGARSFRRAFESKSHSRSDVSSNSNLSMMAIDNLMRSMNKVHMALPLTIIGLPLGAIFLAPIFYPFQFLPYVALIIARCVFHTDIITQLYTRCLSMLIACAVLAASIRGSRFVGEMRRKRICLLLLHVAWVGICFYVEANAGMANKILLAPLQKVINLNDIV